jgi:hypothetical protein
VSAAWDLRADAIVVAWNQYGRASENGDSGYPEDGNWNCNVNFGCSSDINVMLIKADGTDPNPFTYRLGDDYHSTYVFGRSAYGAPAVACDFVETPTVPGAYATYGCEVMYVSTDADRSIRTCRFAVTRDSNDRPVLAITSVAGASASCSPSEILGGATTDQISYAGIPGWPFVAAVRGLDDVIYYNYKSRIQAPWSGWRRVSISPGFPVRASTGPSLAVRGVPMECVGSVPRWDISFDDYP